MPITPVSTSTATQRVDALSQHLQSPRQEKKSVMSDQVRPPITCHVLDTSVGRPAAGIHVELTLHNLYGRANPDDKYHFKGSTNADGRVTQWVSESTQEPLASVYERAEGDTRWSLTFYTDDYFKKQSVDTFFPQVDIHFVVKSEKHHEHYHVPVLLSPFGYTTYRG
ncbi:Hydroxyisourate hydrolase, partial [Corynespora cassiicola Philippines]